MARPVPTSFADKLARVGAAVAAARDGERRHFDVTAEVEPGVRLVVSDGGTRPLVFSLWSLPQDVAELCSDASVPATAALLALDEQQARELRGAGVAVDLGQLARSQAHPGLYYTLFDYAGERQVHAVLHRIVPALHPDHGAV